MSQSRNPCSFGSSVKHLLHTNIAPTAQQCAWIPDILAQRRRDLAALDEEIQRIQQSLDELMGKRGVLAADIDDHLALLSPVRRIPDDVLREIFISCLPHMHNAIMSSRESPLLLCHVSSGWRNIALSTPRLWSSLHVVIPSGSRFQIMSSLVEGWLARSGVLPLSLSVGISLSTAASFFYSDIANVSTLLDLLFAAADRWEAIDFITPINYTIDWLSQPLSALAPAHVPRLTHVKFCCENTAALSSPFLAAPSISSFSSSYIPRDIGMLSTISWSSLTRLELGSTNNTCLWGGQQTLLILQRCVNLEVCTLTIMTANFELIPGEIADLPHLTSLNVTCHDRTIAELIFRRMRVPQLTSLVCSEPPTSAVLLFPRLTTKTPTLRNLDITSTFNRHILLQLVRLASVFPPSLETLRISSMERLRFGSNVLAINDEVLDALDVTVLPVLTDLTIRGCSALTDAGVLSYIRTRADSSAPLKFLAITFTRDMEEDILPALAEFISEGLVVSLKYEPVESGPTYRPWEFTDVVD